MMRERGWDIGDPDCTDWEKFTMDKEYEAEAEADATRAEAAALLAEAQEQRTFVQMAVMVLESTKDDYGFLLKWFGSQKYASGKTFLD